MWKYVVLGIAAAVVVVMQACSPKAQESCGFVQNVYGERISWKGELPIKLFIHESVPKQYIPSIQEAARSWEDATGKKLFEVSAEPISGPLNPARDNKNVIYFLKAWEDDKNIEQARTSIYWIGDQLKEADIRINGSFNYYPTAATADPELKPKELNMQALIIHELGHVLGLKHKDADGSVMATYLSNNTDRTTIADSDKTALQCEY
jgi:hypothetical protein